MSLSDSLKVIPERKTDGIFEELKDVQRKFHYLPTEEMLRIARERNLDPRDVYSIASYYPHFHLEAPAKVAVKICDDMSCHLRGAPELKARLERRFQGISPHDLSIGTVSCVGRCDHAPCMVINDRYYDGFSADEAVEAVAATRAGHPREESKYRRLDMKLKCDPYDGERPYTALRDYVQSKDKEGLLAKLKNAGLRGMGGAGFPTVDKWRTVSSASQEKKRYVICNADESEPGTLKDRFILTQLPHLVIEGMVLAGLCVGAKRGYLYIRHEYQEQREILIEELNRCGQENLIGDNILGSGLSFQIIVFDSPGGYICGEETALLEAIEGRRAEPRNKPPFLANVGLWGMPTLVNNVETLAFAAAIAARGAEWFNEHGKTGYKGPKFVGVSGDVKEPGIYEVPMGITYSEIVNNYAGGPPEGKEILAFAPSGPSSGFLPASKLELPLDWEILKKEKSMVGSGAIVVFAKGRCMLEMAFNAVRFYRNESCGKCVPCRIGSQKLVEILQRWLRSEPEPQDRQLVQELSFALQVSICGLGQVVSKPLDSVLLYFPDDVNEHLVNRRCPVGTCFQGAGS